MLKGTWDIDVEFTVATMIFVVISLVMFGQLLGPLVVVNYSIETSADEIRATEFANLAKHKFVALGGDGKGNVMLSFLSSLEDIGISGMGIARNYIKIEDILLENEIEISGEDGEEHDVYMTASTNSLKLSGRDIVMRSGKLYYLHAYRVSDKNVLEVYDRIICRPEDSGAVPLCNIVSESLSVHAYDAGVCRGSGYTVFPLCSEFESAATVESRESLANELLAVKNSATDRKLMRFSSANEFTAGSSLFDDFEVRHAGNFIVPLKLHAEIDDDMEFLVLTGGGESG